MQSVVIGGGCFWCLDAAYRMIKGVDSVVSGYAGGTKPDPSYYDVGVGNTGHAEVIEVKFDPDQISIDEIFEIFFTLHDPTTKDRQGADVGSQYRSIILYSDEKQKLAAEKAIANIQQLFENPVVTELKPLDEFYPAEEYHQNYFTNNQTQSYCQVVINPKLAKLRDKFNKHIKKDVGV